MPLQGAAVIVLFALWSLVAGAAGQCAAVRAVCALELGWYGAAGCCQSAVSALELGWWLPLQGDPARCAY